jgi:hypothetical protein
MTAPMMRRLERVETHVGTKAGKGLLRFGDRTYSGTAKIIVRKGDDIDQIIKRKRAVGEIGPDALVIANVIVSATKRSGSFAE